MADSISGLSIESVSGAYSKYSNTTVDTDSGDDTSSYIDFESYLKILAAQMSNQDFNDPMSDSEMLQQMASYSMLEGIQAMTEQANITYAASLVGKAVTVNDNGTYDTGLVDSVVVDSGTAYLVINGYKYEVDDITNIADADIYNKLSLLIDQEVTATSSGVSKTGTVTNVLIIDGEGYVVVDSDYLYSLSDITLNSSSSSTTSSDSTDESTEESADSDGESDSVEYASLSSDTDTVTAYNMVQNSTVSALGYRAQSAALFDELMSTIDAISGNDTQTQTETEIIPDVSGYETVTITYLDTIDYAAGVFADDDEILEVLSAGSVSAVNDSESNVASTSKVSAASSRSLRSGNYDVKLTASNLSSVAASARNGRVSSILTNDEVYTVLNDDSYNTRYSSRYGLEVQSDTKPGISTSDCEPHRLNASEYPEETALADSLGTKMYDVKYINNHDITSRIDTSTVIGTTMSGREITEIGYSGEGKLGEVVTFKDGTQRVEILLDNGNSCWLNTSGNYTLDEICDFNCTPGSLTGKLTPFEIAIRNYSREKTSSDYASMSAFKSQLVSMGVGVTTA